MPNYNEIFYYQEKQSEQRFGSNPPGEIDVPRLINNKAYWKIPSLATTKKKKTLILADWTVMDGSFLDIDAALSVISQLLSDGFEMYIYIYWFEKLVPLKKETLDIFNEQYFIIPPVFPEQLVSIAVKQYNLTRDKIHILDNYWLKNLSLETDSLPDRSLRISDLKNKKTSEVQTIIAITNKAMPAFTKMIHDEFSSSVNIASQALPEEIKDKVEIRYEKLHLTKQEKHLVTSFFIDKKPITLGNTTISYNQLSSIKRLFLEALDANLLKQFDVNDLRQLEELSIYNSTLSPDDITQLHKLLESAINLKHLNLSLCKIEGDIHRLNVSLPKLKVLDVSGSNITMEGVQGLLEKMPNIKKINISYCKHLKGDLVLNTPLANLDNLEINDSNISAPSLINLLENASHIKALNLSDCSGLDGRFDFELQKPLLALNKIDISGSNIDTKILQKLLLHAVHIKKLRLSRQQKLTIDLQGIPLLNLTTLDLSQSEITSENLQNLLSSMPNIESLDLRLCSKLNGTLELKKRLSSIKFLDVSRSDITIKNLETLLYGAEHLRTLLLNDCTYLTGNFFQNTHFPSIKQLNLYNCSIRTQSVQILLKNAINIKELTLGKSHGDLVLEAPLLALKKTEFKVM